jgi:hypothetical protein
VIYWFLCKPAVSRPCPRTGLSHRGAAFTNTIQIIRRPHPPSESVSSALGRIVVQEPWGWSARWMAHAGVRALVAGSAQQQGGAVSSLVRHARHVIG